MDGRLKTALACVRAGGPARVAVLAYADWCAWAATVPVQRFVREVEAIYEYADTEAQKNALADALARIARVFGVEDLRDIPPKFRPMAMGLYLYAREKYLRRWKEAEQEAETYLQLKAWCLPVFCGIDFRRLCRD